MKKLFLKSLAIGMMALIPAMSWAQTLTVNDGTATNSKIPFEGYNCDNTYAHSQMLIKAADLAAMKDKDITKMVFSTNGAAASTKVNPQFTISFVETTSTSVPTSYLSTAGAVVVYTGAVDWHTSTPTIEFDNSFSYKGGNLLIDFSKSVAGQWNTYTFYGVSSTSLSVEAHSSSSMPTTGTAQSFSPKITFSYETPSSCSKTASITVSDITSEGATISWEAVDGAAAYDLTVGSQSFTGLTTTSKVVTGLSGNTTYEVKVVTDCGAEKSGEKKTSFTTACDDLKYNTLFSFEDDAVEAAPGCWQTFRATTSGSIPVVKSNTMSFDGSKSIYMYYYSTKCWVVLPKIDENVDVTNLEVSAFAAHSSSSPNYSCLQVGVMTDPTDINTFEYCQNQFPVKKKENTSTCSSVSLDKITNGGKYIAFCLTASNTIYLDAVKVIKHLAKPTNLQVSAGKDSANVTFDQDDATGITWEYQLNGGTAVPVSSQSFTIKDLMGAKNYNLKIRAVKSEEYSGWAETNFSTECDAFVLSENTPYEQDFSAGVAPACWTIVGAPTFNNTLYMTNASLAFLPEFDYTGISGMENAMITFKKSASKAFKVIAVANPSEVTLENVNTKAVVVKECNNVNNDREEVYVKDVAGQIAGKPYLGFYVSDAYSYVSIDDVVVGQATSRAPSNLAVVAASITDSSAQFTFEQVDSEEAGWICAYSTSSNFATSDSVDIEDGPMSFTLTGLQESTTYYVRLTQAMDPVDNHWSNVVSFTTNCSNLKYAPFAYAFENETNNATPKCWNVISSSATYTAKVSNAASLETSGKSLLLYGYSSYYPITAVMPKTVDDEDMQALKVDFSAKASTANKNLVVGVLTSPTDNSTFVPVDTIIPTTSGWKQYSVNLDSYTGEGEYIGFYTKGDSYSTYSIYLDSIKITKVACKNPAPSISNRTTNSADLASGITTGADWAWKFEGGEENKVDGINASTTITGLIADTEYTVLVQAQCSATEKSEWKSVTFRTRCESVLALGYTEDFSNGIPTCMDTIGAKSKNQQAELAQETALILPIFSSTDYSTLKLTFKASTNNDASPNVYIIAYEEGVALASQVSLDTIVLEEQMKSKTVYLNEIADINTKLAGKRIGFYRSTGAAINIDDVAIVVASNFKAPENLSKVVDSETAEGANFTFEQPGDVKNVWVYEVFADEDLTQLAQRDTINVLSFTLTGLNMKTNYYVQVKQMDGEASSDFSNVVKFTTECGKYANGMSQIDNLESYSGNTSESYVYNNVPSCWTIGQDCNSYSSAPAGIYKNSTYAKSENNAISLTSYKSGYTYYFTWIALPEIDTDDMSLISLKFAARTYSGTEELEIGVMGDPTVKNSYEKIGSVKPTNAYGNYTILFNNYTGDKKYIVFVSNKKSTKFYIDDIKVSESACAMAKDAAASEITDVSAKLTIANATPDWNVVVKDGAKVAFSQNDITDANVVATGLSAQTDYVAYITMNCQGGGVSDTVEVAFTTACGLLTSADMPYQYGFEKGLSDCWTKFGTYPSLQSTPNTGSKSAEMYSSSTTSPNVYVSPEFDINSISLAAYKVSFYARLYGSYSNVGEMRIALASEVPATAADALNLPVAGTITTINSATYSKFEVSLDTVSSIDFTDKKYIVFCLLKSDIYLDDIEFSLLPCVKAQGAAASDVTASSATISITNATPDWNVVVKDGQTEVFSQDDIKTASVNVTGLSEETTYEAIITMNCAGGVVSDPDTVEFTTTATVWELVRDNLSQDQIGTTCLGKNITNVRGGVLYGVNYGTTKSIEFAEKQLPIAAGDPLLFQADGTNGGKLEVVYGSATATEALKDQGKDGVNGFVGLISGASVAIEEGNILVSGGKLHLTGTGCNLTAGHAYIKASELPTQSPAPVQGRRLVLTQNGTAVATGTDEVMINNLEGVQKIVRDGQLIIIRGGQLFNAQGQKL